MKTTAHELVELEFTATIARHGGPVLTRQQMRGIDEVCERLDEIRAELYDLCAWMADERLSQGGYGREALTIGLQVGEQMKRLGAMLILRKMATVRAIQPAHMKRAA